MSSKPSSSALSAAFKAPRPSAAAGAAPPPSLNQQEDFPQDHPTMVEPAPLKAKLADEKVTKHYYEWSVSIQERSRTDGSVQTELHTYMKRPPNAPEHVALLASSFMSSPFVVKSNCIGRVWCAKHNHYVPASQPCDAMCLSED